MTTNEPVVWMLISNWLTLVLIYFRINSIANILESKEDEDHSKRGLAHQEHDPHKQG